ncbi:uncharacterized protein TM35_000272300 [Trypanosoma theileri]|uniref:Uncharacterized protein n=1 Tax=Trypanosoma theileri TaxID=67003 RepID=A0A1X0NRB2_9TRYP|nr:uncharacterized protein TM35_000272300 [Trypanosoma theileri]ORC86640.1 hypothetical protein TM35_000272300 [Trypanosoma theileri]
MAFRGLVGAACVASGFAVTGVVVLTSRWRRLESRRAVLDNEYASILEELSSLDNTRLIEAENLRKKKHEIGLLHETVDTLWNDRLERYKQTNKEMYSYLKALPEALGILKGLTSHYQYMTKEMRKFISFDVACSKVHNFSLLLEHGDRVGIHRVAESIRQLLIAEPLVEVVCDSVINDFTNISAPSTINECSLSFVFCMEELDKAIEAAVSHFLEFQRDRADRAPNVICEGIRKLSDEAKVNTLSSGDIIMQREAKALRDLLLRDKRQLHTAEDLRSALNYVENVISKLNKKNGHDNALQATIIADPAVGIAEEQLLLWRKSASLFLVREQAKEALSAYNLLLAETLTKTKIA